MSLYESLKKIYFNLFSPIRRAEYRRKNKGYKKVIGQNIKFKDCHLGERCFIIGNGPSLKNVDFSSLSDEITFTVNQLPRNENFYKLKTNYHIWNDRIFFEINIDRDGDEELLNVMKMVNTNNHSPKVFYEFRAKKMIEKFNLNSILDIDYYSIHSIPFNPMSNKRIRMDRMMPDFPTVIQIAVCIAVYMGFKEIYLLGCDCSGFVNIPFVKTGKLDNIQYAYKTTESEKNRMLNTSKNRKTIRNELLGYVQMFDKYEEIFKYCNRQNGALYNATEGSLIESIPMVDLKEVFNVKND